jgi:ABC-2 type transport system ATP-binding protein
MSYAVELSGLTKCFTVKKASEEEEMGLLKFVRHQVRKAKAKETILAVNGVSFEIREGELFGLLGPNGAGKTTLIKTLCTLLWPNAGTTTIHGHDIRREPKAVRASIGTVLDIQMGWYGRLSCRQNLLFYAQLYGTSPSMLKERIRYVLDLMGLGEKCDEWQQKLSSGMKRKLDIARALISDPPVLLLDEPTLGLDVESSRELRKIIKQELCGKQNKTVLLTTHNMDEAEQMCDRVAVMHKGRIIAMGETDYIKSIVKSSEKVVCEVGRMNTTILESIRKMADVISVASSSQPNSETHRLEIYVKAKEVVPRISEAIMQNGGLLHLIMVEEPSLEDALIELTSGGRQ